jgi:hypothetical protein
MYIVEASKESNMKKSIAIFTLFTIILMGNTLAVAQNNSLKIPIKKLYSAPKENSKLIFDVPMEVNIIEISEDGNWVRVEVSYSFGLLSNSFEGWTYIPLSEIMAKKESESTESTPVVCANEEPPK